MDSDEENSQDKYDKLNNEFNQKEYNDFVIKPAREMADDFNLDVDDEFYENLFEPIPSFNNEPVKNKYHDLLYHFINNNITPLKAVNMTAYEMEKEKKFEEEKNEIDNEMSKIYAVSSISNNYHNNNMNEENLQKLQLLLAKTENLAEHYEMMEDYKTDEAQNAEDQDERFELLRWSDKYEKMKDYFNEKENIIRDLINKMRNNIRMNPSRYMANFQRNTGSGRIIDDEPNNPYSNILKSRLNKK